MAIGRKKILKLQSLGLTRKEIYNKTGLSESTQKRIVNRKNYKPKKQTIIKMESIDYDSFKYKRKKDSLPEKISDFTYFKGKFSERKFFSQSFTIDKTVNQLQISDFTKAIDSVTIKLLRFIRFSVTFNFYDVENQLTNTRTIGTISTETTSDLKILAKELFYKLKENEIDSADYGTIGRILYCSIQTFTQK